MGLKYSLGNLRSIYWDALRRNEPTIAFELKNGRGRFLFMLFFDEKDNEVKDYIYIYLKNTQKMISLKLYGKRMAGVFDVYLKSSDEKLFINELGLANFQSGTPFVFANFFSSLNAAIPNELSLQSTITAIRPELKKVIGYLPKDVVDESDRIYLKEPMRLPKGKAPREQTLRKLYFYADGNAEQITGLINRLKSVNQTVRWTNDIAMARSVSLVTNDINF